MSDMLNKTQLIRFKST